MFFFKSDNIFLRALEPTDLELIYTWENEVALWNLSNTHKPFSKHVLEAFINEAHLDIFTNKSQRFIICTNAGLAIGAIDMFDFDPFNLRAGVGILIADKQYRKQGFANEAVMLLVKYAKEVLLLNQLFCNINSDNIASIKLFMRNGFEIAGNKKSWNKTKSGFTDELFLQLLLISTP